MPTHDPLNNLADQLLASMGTQPHEDPVSMGWGEVLKHLFSSRPESKTLPNASGQVDPRIAQLDPAQALAHALGKTK